MRKLAPALTAFTLAAVLSACGSEAGPAPAPTPTIAAPTTPSASSTSSPAPSPPVMPEAATKHTQAGAKAFVVYYWTLVDYAQHSLDSDRLDELSNPACAGCTGGIDFIEGVASGSCR